MDADRVHALRDALRHTEWWSRATLLGGALRATSGPGHLLLVGTPRVEPWHLAAHLDDEARLSGLDQLAPSLVRWNPPTQAPPHLAIGLSRLERVARGETVFVVTPDAAPDPLLERVNDARRIGATILALDAQAGPLADLAHERMTVSPSGLSLPEGLQEMLAPAAGDAPDPGPRRPGPDGGRLDSLPDLPPEVAAGLTLPASFEVAQHFVSAAAGEPDEQERGGWRRRLAALLDAISGPRPSPLGG
jgi:hypothetical protein